MLAMHKEIDYKNSVYRIINKVTTENSLCLECDRFASTLNMNKDHFTFVRKAYASSNHKFASQVLQD